MSADPGSRIHVAAWGYAEAAFTVSLGRSPPLGWFVQPPKGGISRAVTGCTLKQLGGSGLDIPTGELGLSQGRNVATKSDGP